MIIDCHVHLKGGDVDRTEYDAARIVSVMDDAGIDRSVVFAMCETTRDSARRVAAALQEFPDRLIGFVYALPSFADNVLDELKRAADQGCRGIKLHAGETQLRPWVVDKLFAFAGESSLPILLDAKGDYANVERLSREFPDTNLICAHLGNMSEADTRRIIDLAAQRENLLLDTSYVRMTQYIARAIAAAGADKILFGSDGPEVNVKVELYKIKVLELSEKDAELVLGGNLLRLIGETAS
ncbi:MAG: amidohydrolase family protein [Planctomycetes bacterium]|nr:amidohydrolase family protein [Planctomycetota bacterium]